MTPNDIMLNDILHDAAQSNDTLHNDINHNERHRKNRQHNDAKHIDSNNRVITSAYTQPNDSRK